MDVTNKIKYNVGSDTEAVISTHCVKSNVCERIEGRIQGPIWFIIVSQASWKVSFNTHERITNGKCQQRSQK